MDKVKCGSCKNISEVEIPTSRAWEFYAKLDKEAKCCGNPDYHIYYEKRRVGMI